MQEFLNKSSIALKVCGVLCSDDAEKLIEMKVEALGVNFWPKSKRYCAEEQAVFLKPLQGRILRVGVFVNADREIPERLIKQGYIDVAQFHGDEDLEYCQYFAEKYLPYFRAIGVKDEKSVEDLQLPGCRGLLLDAHAPDVYGGTGETCDWNVVEKVNQLYPDLPIILAGGITVDNVAEARKLNHIVALDVASGAEISPGVKDFTKVAKLME